MTRQLKTFLIISTLLLYSCRQERKHILVIPGLGLVISEDTIKLSKTTESEIFHLFNMTDTLIDIDHGSACGYDADGNDVSWDTYSKKIYHDGIVFNYSGGIYKDSMTLEEIEISDTTHWTVKVNDSIVLGKNMPDVLKYFPRQDSSDGYDNYSKELSSYGINLLLDDNGRHKKLSYISVYKSTGTKK